MMIHNRCPTYYPLFHSSYLAADTFFIASSSSFNACSSAKFLLRPVDLSLKTVAALRPDNSSDIFKYNQPTAVLIFILYYENRIEHRSITGKINTNECDSTVTRPKAEGRVPSQVTNHDGRVCIKS